MTTVRPARRRAFASSRGLDRVVFFTDAISAIAITLLVLPLVDLVPDSAQEVSAWEFMVENSPQLLSFAISFVVIARLWYAHHQIFEHVGRYTAGLALLSVLWAFTVVVLPLPTAMTAEFDPTDFTIAFYIGTMLVSSLTLTAMALLIRGDPHVEASDNPITRRSLVNSITTSGLFAAAFVLGVFVPSIGYWSLTALVLSGPMSAIVLRVLNRARPAPGDAA